MMKPTLLVLAAGMGSRYGGNKQLDEVGPSGETIIDYSIYDAIRAGFGRIVFVIRRDIEEQVKERFVEGRMEKFFKDIGLLEQPFVKDPSKTVNDVVLEAISKIGEKISVRRFVRYEMGEGLEKKSCNFADEVDAEIAKMSK